MPWPLLWTSLDKIQPSENAFARLRHARQWQAGSWESFELLLAMAPQDSCTFFMSWRAGYSATLPPPASVFAFVRRNCPLFACMDDPFSIVIVVSLQENVMKWFEDVWGMPSDQLQKGLVTNCSLNSFASIYTYTVAQEFIWLAFLPTTLCLHLFVLLCFCQVLPPCLFVRIWPEMSLLARPYPGCVFSLFLRQLVLKTVFIFFRYLMPEPLLIGGLQVEIMFL